MFVVRAGGHVEGSCEPLLSAAAAAIPLVDVFDCSEWREVTEASRQRRSSDLYLVATTFEEFAAFSARLAGGGDPSRAAYVLSYRWVDCISVDKCVVRGPGIAPSQPRDCELPVDAFRALDRLADGSFMWVDFLAHLHDPARVPVVINHMGDLYTQNEVWPLYLQDFAGKQAPTGADAEAVLDALRRGWIQQEVSFGRLNEDVVLAFLRACVHAGEFGLLGSLVRRRGSALVWLLRSCEESWQESSREGVVKQLNVADLTDNDYVAQEQEHRKEVIEALGGFLLESPETGGASSKVVDACRALLIIKLADPSITAKLRLQLKTKGYKPWLNQEAEKVSAALLQQSLAGEPPPAFFLEFAERLSAPQWKQQQQQQQQQQQLDPSADPFGAFQILRAFAESRIKEEDDAFVAMTQCAAAAAGLPWAAGGATDDDDKYHNMAILRACWRTLVRAAGADSKLQFSFNMNRIDRRCWTAGLGHIPELEAKLAQQAAAAASTTTTTTTTTHFRIRIAARHDEEGEISGEGVVSSDVAIVFKLDEGGVKQVIIKSTKDVDGIVDDTFADVTVEFGKKTLSVKSPAASETVGASAVSAAGTIDGSGGGFSLGSAAKPPAPAADEQTPSATTIAIAAAAAPGDASDDGGSLDGNRGGGEGAEASAGSASWVASSSTFLDIAVAAGSGGGGGGGASGGGGGGGGGNDGKKGVGTGGGRALASSATSEGQGGTGGGGLGSAATRRYARLSASSWAGAELTGGSVGKTERGPSPSFSGFISTVLQQVHPNSKDAATSDLVTEEALLVVEDFLRESLGTLCRASAELCASRCESLWESPPWDRVHIVGEDGASGAVLLGRDDDDRGTWHEPKWCARGSLGFEEMRTKLAAWDRKTEAQKTQVLLRCVSAYQRDSDESYASVASRSLPVEYAPANAYQPAEYDALLASGDYGALQSIGCTSLAECLECRRRGITTREGYREIEGLWWRHLYDLQLPGDEGGLLKMVDAEANIASDPSRFRVLVGEGDQARGDQRPLAVGARIESSAFEGSDDWRPNCTVVAVHRVEALKAEWLAVAASRSTLPYLKHAPKVLLASAPFMLAAASLSRGAAAQYASEELMANSDFAAELKAEDWPAAQQPDRSSSRSSSKFPGGINSSDVQTAVRLSLPRQLRVQCESDAVAKISGFFCGVRPRFRRRTKRQGTGQRRSLGDEIGLDIPVELVGSLITKFTGLTVSDSAVIYMSSVLEDMTERVLTLACACACAGAHAGAYAGDSGVASGGGIPSTTVASASVSECVAPRHIFLALVNDTQQLEPVFRSAGVAIIGGGGPSSSRCCRISSGLDRPRREGRQDEVINAAVGSSGSSAADGVGGHDTSTAVSFFDGSDWADEARPLSAVDGDALVELLSGAGGEGSGGGATSNEHSWSVAAAARQRLEGHHFASLRGAMPCEAILALCANAGARTIANDDDAAHEEVRRAAAAFLADACGGALSIMRQRKGAHLHPADVLRALEFGPARARLWGTGLVGLGAAAAGHAAEATTTTSRTTMPLNVPTSFGRQFPELVFDWYGAAEAAVAAAATDGGNHNHDEEEDDESRSAEAAATAEVQELLRRRHGVPELQRKQGGQERQERQREQEHPYPFFVPFLPFLRLVDEIGRTLHESDSGEYPEMRTASALGGGDARAYRMAVRILFEALQAHLVGLLQGASQ